MPSVIDFAILCPAYSIKHHCHVYKLVDASNSGRKLAASVDFGELANAGRSLKCIPDNQIVPSCDGKDCCGGQTYGSAGYPCYCTHCFPSDASVLLENGSRKVMSELQVGDRVQVVDTATGKLGFSDVYTWMDKHSSIVKNYLKLTVAGRSNNSTKELQVSDNHFVYAAKPSAPLSQARLVHAKYVEVGDAMWLAFDGESQATEGIVTSVATVTNTGAWAPYTLAGSIVVDGVVAHSDADLPLGNGVMLADVIGHIVPPEWYQFGTAPLRMLYRLGMLNEKHLVFTRSALIAVGQSLLALQSAFGSPA